MFLTEIFCLIWSRRKPERLPTVFSLSHYLYKLLCCLFLDNITAVSISATALDGMRLIPSISGANASSLLKYSQRWNHLAEARDYLTSFISNLIITTIESIILQSTMLAQITEITPQLTRDTTVCFFFVWDLNLNLIYHSY